MTGKINRRCLSFAGLGAALTMPAIAQGNHPGRTIRVMIGFPPDLLPELRRGAYSE